MNRDFDLIRALLLKLEQDIGLHAVTYDFRFTNKKPQIADYDDEAIYGHLVMLLGSPFVDGERFASGEIRIKTLTWVGRDFLDSVRDDGIWARTKQGALAAEGFTFDLLKDLAKGLIKQQIKARTGVDL